ncbi:hypothetical protein M1B34_12250 [Pseudomonas sp. MAFF 302030]|jgi:hypothetical protein|uniref:Threonine transporter n=1 Tax=Pseudomonas morbosilactucae TaxID=2938197 RepID=A0A9X1YUR7_9PSED|nr:ABC-three component system middle component 2 [Pseudomonas morbosilactucae]MCK9798477.1 hypothetical protein [Pseudomonas morbosilactucae]
MNLETDIFNSTVEIGTRASLILTYLHEAKLDLDQLAFLDYALIYAEEFCGLGNIHPPLPNHFAELIRRRETLPDALKLFISKGIINSSISEQGIFYHATDKAIYFAGSLKTNYYKKLFRNLAWIEENFDSIIAKQKTFFTTRMQEA